MNKNSKNKKIMPKDINAEKMLLGKILTNPAKLLIVEEYLNRQCFYKVAHRYIYETILSLYNANKPIDVLTVSEELKLNNKLEKIGGRKYINDFATNVITTSDIEDYAKILKEKAIKRALIFAGKRIVSQGYNKKSADESIDIADNLISDIAFFQANKNIELIKDLTIKKFQEIEQHFTSNEEISGYSTGFVDLDWVINGLQPSDLIVIASRPSMGKSAFAMNIAQHVAIKGKKTVAYFSLEMTKSQLMTRILASESEIKTKKIATGNLYSQDWDKLLIGMDDVIEAPIWIDDTSGSTLTDIKAKCRRIAKEEKGLDLIVIDYLQLMENSGNKDRSQQISEISKGLKNLARELNIPVILLSQLPNTIKQRKNKLPDLSDLKEMYTLEQYADIIILIHRDGYEKRVKLGKNNNYKIIIAKNRHDEPVLFFLEFQRDIAKFKNIISQKDKIKSVFNATEL